MAQWLGALMLSHLSEEKMKDEVAKYLPLCPFCQGKTVNGRRDSWSGKDTATCCTCGAKWHLYCSQWTSEMKWAELVATGTEGGENLLGAKRDPLFWRDTALNNHKQKGKTENETTGKVPIREIIREKEVIVKIRCSYCKHAYEETSEKCPNCGGLQ